MKRIIVGVDGSPESTLAVKKAVELGKPFNAEIILIHVVNVNLIDILSKSMGENIQKIKAQLHVEGKKVLEHDKKIVESAGLPVKTIITDGVPCIDIIKKAKEENADLIILGSTGVHKAKGMLGSTAERCVRFSDISVLIVK